ncbi:MAG: type II toxin-antitoxin system PemK/MazF family toxin [Bryobacteraceae bacterium]
MAGTLSRGDVRLCRFAPPDKERPVLVLTRDSAIGHLATVTVAPITSTIRGVPRHRSALASYRGENAIGTPHRRPRCRAHAGNLAALGFSLACD